MAFGEETKDIVTLNLPRNWSSLTVQKYAFTFSSGTQNLYGSGGLSYGTSSANSTAYIGLGDGTVRGNTISNTGVGVSLSNGNLGFRGENNNSGLGIGGYRRSSDVDIPLTSSYSAPNGGFDGPFSEFYSSSSVNDDPIYRSSNFEPDGFDPFGYGLGVVASDVSAKCSPGYVGSYTVNKRQPNKD
ncbi:uncharacterized protein LOC130746713 [Lotus japonicus]|uniref:uncharacterized protein LOC130746713 n=1 Tax=Lotus japonicus TaxID=34305 RepID=UPI0025843022|nr:uncharacterized protein LOC130746713 [Lotus japonicus]XP_057455404.1 uncharacterized protein LOC130746713 [Lotus japonicus]XP_057455405.1 uncharacterized protein LOC130746713 [Lotus japonicus]XP_057455406.1 uncharacterized protein LOC130746713 [Lotus japonicus]XP_057455407.1 uncharacterized protein LOC130746713 [Lotus japonicus]XP_057455408.1 uncharacterized protein LOC130746713 [Lotus japonicus]